MRRLDVEIEIMGRQKEVGCITGDSEYDAFFAYSEDYLNTGNAHPISISLPLRKEAFSPEQTRNFFEGLLPEGFIRRTVAKNNRIAADDYLSLLGMLGSECLGAITIKGDDYRRIESSYKRLDTDLMYDLAAEGATKSADLVVESHLSLTGASGKIGVYRDEHGDWYLPIGNAPSTHILKQSHIRYDFIIQNEQLALLTAEGMGIETPGTVIINNTKAHSEDEIMLATERYDRNMDGSIKTISGLPCPLRLHQEDFGQALGISAANKYERPGEHHMRDMFNILRAHSASPIVDQIKLWDIIIFHYLIGNTDGHIKNFSLLYDSKLKSKRLAPAYDIVSTVVYDSHSSEMAFSIGGVSEWDELDRNSFVKAAEECGLNQSIFMRRFDEMQSRFDRVLRSAAEKMADDGYSEAHMIAKTITEKRKR